MNVCEVDVHWFYRLSELVEGKFGVSVHVQSSENGIHFALGRLKVFTSACRILS